MSTRKSRDKRRQHQSKQQTSAAKLILAGLSIVAFVMYINWDSSQTAEPLADERTISLGQQVFQQNCASCHGEQGEGHAAIAQAPALNDKEHAWHHPDGQLQELILNGGIEMPSFQDELSNEEVAAVIRYFQTLWRPDQLKVQQENSTQNPLR